MTQYLKKSTQLVGLAVSKAPRQSLVDLYMKTITVLGSMPKTSVYRQQTEEITKHRLNLANTEEDVMKLEQKINCGQIEEVLIQARDELSLAEQMTEWKPWEAPESSEPHGQWS
ncbi:NADH dehydrogenase [ubiquinone] 1 alpha subcomplex subunit 5-like [Hydractinia symbiolongicarpus]|uniref:NADH dehydrogenase [ubiquinone] 1 alpha subcomplex subunit 5-like n=1 Tax=Hydractinia symbiolongicarpus TaxID=13093 RepID=UPI00254E4362|nr:NADH dehydrogenase [ubiquinone] 1 alpha subcomplex subunit 5-like [Hydractinia symbiolongicarpus]